MDSSENDTQAAAQRCTNNDTHPNEKIGIFQVDRGVALARAQLDDAVRQVLDHAQFILGPQVNQLERKLAEYVGVEHCITVANGTDALELTLTALGIGEGHEVITTPFSWISSAEAIATVGATPVFIDLDPSDPDFFLLDHRKIRRAITPRTRAVLAVSLFGRIADLAAIQAVLGDEELRKSRGCTQKIALIEDGAQSFGAMRNGVRSCGWNGSIGCTSFFPTKPLGCFGDGGAVFCSSAQVAERVRALRAHGKLNNKHTYVGRNSRLDTLQAAILLVMLARFPDDLRLRVSRAERYSTLFQSDARVTTPSQRNTSDSELHAYGVYTVRVSADVRDLVVARLQQRGIGASVYYRVAISDQPVFAHLQQSPAATHFPTTFRATQTAISLPIGPHLTDAEIDRVVAEFQAALNEATVSAAAGRGGGGGDTRSAD